MANRHNPRKYLEIYLRDHMAAAVAGVELARRMRDAERHNALGEEIEVLLEAIVEDRRTLERLMDQLEVSSSQLKKSTAWFGEKLARLKSNGRVVRRSPLSPVLELEGLTMAATGKRSLWEALRTLPIRRQLSDIDLDEMIQRADDQLEMLRELHRIVAEQTFSSPGAEPRRPSAPPF